MTRPGKPAGLVTRAETKAKKAQRAQKENALRPKQRLSLNPPARLKDYKIACYVWRKLMRRFSELEAEIVTGLDWILVENYCLSVQELDDLMDMLKVANKLWLELGKRHNDLTKEDRFDEAIIIATQVVGAYDAVNKAHVRIDSKKKLIHQLSQSLYIEPRARAGTAPSQKAPEPEKSDSEKLYQEFMGHVKQDDI